MIDKGEFVLKAIKEVGFPIIAFFVIAYMCFVTLEGNTEAINNLSIVISNME